jgi:hypothetical protein
MIRAPMNREERTMRRNRTLQLLAVGAVLVLGAMNLSCQGYMSVGVGVPIGGAWGGYGYGTVGVTVPIGR